jgi:periplasmic protein TonB
MSQRTLLLLGDIAAVPRRSPPRARKRTPWHPQPDGEVMTARAGDREWFSDRVFVEPQDGHRRSGYSMSLVVHLCGSAALLAFLATRSVQSIVVRTEGLAMPAFVSQVPTMPVPVTPASRTIDPRPSSTPAVRPAAAAAPTPADVDGTAAPIEAPSGVTAETGLENRVAGVVGGVAEGIVGGVAGGTGTESSASGSSGPIVMRAGTGGMKLPRKIKDVKPVYPAGALPTRAQGVVLIEATIGADGRVLETRLLHSANALLDEAALDAVRQWLYEPTVLNGMPVAVLITVVVNYALQ